MLPLTQYTEQLPLFNAMNFNLNVYDSREHHDQRHRAEDPLVPVRSRGRYRLYLPQRLRSDRRFRGAGIPEIMRYSSYAGCAGAWFNYQFGNIATRRPERRLLLLQRDQTLRHHGRDEQHDHVRRAHPGDRERGRQELLALVDLGQLRRHDLHRVLADQPPEDSCRTPAPTARACRTSSLAVSSHASGRGECRTLRRLGPVHQGVDRVPGRIRRRAPAAPPGMVMSPQGDVPSCSVLFLRLDPDPRCDRSASGRSSPPAMAAISSVPTLIDIGAP